MDWGQALETSGTEILLLLSFLQQFELKEEILSTFASNAKLEKVATGLDDSYMPEKKLKGLFG